MEDDNRTMVNYSVLISLFRVFVHLGVFYCDDHMTSVDNFSDLTDNYGKRYRLLVEDGNLLNTSTESNYIL